MSFQFGSAIGLALVTAVVVAATGTSGTAEAAPDGYRAALLILVVAAAIGVLLALPGRTAARRPATV